MALEPRLLSKITLPHFVDSLRPEFAIVFSRPVSVRVCMDVVGQTWLPFSFPAACHATLCHIHIHTYIYICSYSIVSCTHLHIEHSSSYSCGASSEMPMLKGGALTRRVCLAAAKCASSMHHCRASCWRERAGGWRPQRAGGSGPSGQEVPAVVGGRRRKTKPDPAWPVPPTTHHPPTTRPPTHPPRWLPPSP